MQFDKNVNDKFLNTVLFKFKNILSRNVLYRLFIGITTIHLTANHVVDFTLTTGPSMEPLIDPNGTLAIYTRTTFNKLLRGPKTCYRKGDVIIAKSTQNSNKRICKRIVGLEGEKSESGIIPTGFVWVEGDAKNNSLDSRHYGPIPVANVLGRVRLIISPNAMKII